MVNDFPQVVAALNAVPDLTEDLANLVLDGIRPSSFLLEGGQVRKQALIDEVEQVVAGQCGVMVLEEATPPDLQYRESFANFLSFGGIGLLGSDRERGLPTGQTLSACWLRPRQIEGLFVMSLLSGRFEVSAKWRRNFPSVRQSVP